MAENLSQDQYNKEQLEQARLTAPLNVSPKANSKGTADNYSQSKQRTYESDEADHSEQLSQARGENNRSSGLINSAKSVASVASPMGAFSLLKQINLLADMPYVVAMGAALIKDLTDLATFEMIILPIIFSALCSILIFMMLFIAGSGARRKKAQKIMQKGLLVIGGGIIDSIPGLDILPAETLTVAATYVLTLAERKNQANDEQLETAASSEMEYDQAA